MAQEPDSAVGQMTGTTRDLPSRLTTAELADFWRVSIRTIERWVAAEQCPAPVRIGGRLLWRREDVLAWEALRLAGGDADQIETRPPGADR